jgi:hypothetical protein
LTQTECLTKWNYAKLEGGISDGKHFFYNAKSGEAVIGAIEEDEFQRVFTFSAGAFGYYWTHVAESGRSKGTLLF